MLGAFFLVSANLAVTAGAFRLRGQFVEREHPCGAVIVLGLRILLISAVVLTAGLVHQLNAVAIGCVSIATFALWRPWLASCWPLTAAGPRLGWKLGLILGIVAIRLVAQVWLFAPYNSDALSYHLTKVGEWIRTERFGRELGLDTHASLPAGFELVEAWWCVFLHHDALIEMAGLEFVLLAFFAVVSLAKGLGMGGTWPAVAGLLYVLVPGVQVAATSCLNDLPVAALLIAGAALIVSRAPFAMTLSILALGIGVKPTFGFLLPGLGTIHWQFRNEPLAVAKSRRGTVVVLILSLAVGGFWYARNALWYGNPFHPVGMQGLRARTGELKIQMGPSWGSASKNASALAYRVRDSEGKYTSLFISISGWGGVSFACGLIALLKLAREDARLRNVALGFGVSLISLLCLINHDPWFMRFALFFPAILMIAVVRLMERMPDLTWIAGAAAAGGFLLTMAPADLTGQEISSLIEQPWRERSLARLLGVWNDHSTVAYYLDEPTHGRGPSYLLYRPDFSCRVVFLRPTCAQELVSQMDQQDVRQVFIPWTSSSSDPILDECLRRRLLVREGKYLFRRF